MTEITKRLIFLKARIKRTQAILVELESIRDYSNTHEQIDFYVSKLEADMHEEHLLIAAQEIFYNKYA